MRLFSRSQDSQPEAAATPAKAAAPKAADAPQYATRKDLDDAIAVVGIAIREAAEGSRDQFFSLARFYDRLNGIAEGSAPGGKRFLKCLLTAMQGNASRSYGVDRGRPGQPWSTM